MKPWILLRSLPLLLLGAWGAVELGLFDLHLSRTVLEANYSMGSARSRGGRGPQREPRSRAERRHGRRTDGGQEAEQVHRHL